MFSESQVKVILILLDEKGYAEWYLAEHIKMKESNLNPVLKKLKEMGIIVKKLRDSRRPKSEPGTKGYQEFACYLNKSLETLKTIIRELKGKKYPQIDAGFILNIISRSKYIKVMIDLFGEEVNKSAKEELNKTFPFAKNGFYTNWVGDLFPKDLSDFKERQVILRDSKLIKRLPTPYIEEMEKEMAKDLRVCRSNIEIWYDNYLESISLDHENHDP
ncbi:MAG: hypothetical protein NTU95_08980 [Methanothrix sp.]|nr:hypothetical protein [Methanothrix sp.]